MIRLPETSNDAVVEAKPTNEPTTGVLNESSAADAFLSRWNVKDDGTPKDAAKPSKETEEQKEEKETTDESNRTDADAETPSDKVEEETEDKADDTPKRKYAEDDDVYVKVKVGDEEQEFSVKDLKRLAGQEAALTRRSQETAELRKVADAEQAKALAVLQVMTKRAQDKAEPYKKIDFLQAAQHLNPQELEALRSEAVRFLDEEKFMLQETGNFMKALNEKNTANTRAAAKACVDALKDQAGPHYIEGWSDKVYDELRAFAVNQGVDRSIVDQLVDPAAIKLLHFANAYMKGQSKVTTTKVNKTAKKIVKTTKVVEPPRPEDASDKQRKADARLRRSGKVDDAAEAFLSRWHVDKDS